MKNSIKLNAVERKFFQTGEEGFQRETSVNGGYPLRDFRRIAVKKSLHGTRRENTKKPLRLF